MTILTLTDAHLLPNEFKLARVGAGIDVFGFLFPIRHDGGPMLVDARGGTVVYIPLDGAGAFRRIETRVGGAMHGLLFEQMKIAVDATSRVDPHADAQVGDLIFEMGRMNIVSLHGNDKFAPPHTYPLPVELDSDDCPGIGFRRWSIVIERGADSIELWRHHGFAPPEPHDEDDD